MKRTQQYSFTNSRKRASGFTSGVFQDFYFEVFIFVHYIGISIKEKCSPFNQSIMQQPIMSRNKAITPMTELYDPSSYSVHVLIMNKKYSPRACKGKPPTVLEFMFRAKKKQQRMSLTRCLSNRLPTILSGKQSIHYHVSLF